MTSRSLQTFLIVLLAAIGLTLLFWWPIWTGGGFVGGDVYSYFLPQKVFYADRLADGELPLWNNRVGFGYPLLGESQTGVLYPINLLLFRVFDVHTAYNVNHILHYILAFVFTWMYARSLGFTRVASLLPAIVFTYGWFPSRTCWEWAIITGAWIPLVFWCVERFLQSRYWRYLFGLSLVLTLQMLAGHFNLAFITQTALVGYVILRLWFASADLPQPTILFRKRIAGMLTVAVAVAFGMSAVQLFPTWEMKQHSQRAQVGEEHDLSYGIIPAGYWSQIVMPWRWYSIQTDRDTELRELIQKSRGSTEPSTGDWQLGTTTRTNQVEAHLYFGLVPLGLAILGVIAAIKQRDRICGVWVVLGLAAFFHTAGWFLPMLQFLPGFSFFQGPGRFGVLTTLAVGILAAKGFERLHAAESKFAAPVGLAFAAYAGWSCLQLAGEVESASKQLPSLEPYHILGFSVVDISSCLLIFAVVVLVLSVLTHRIRSRSRPQQQSTRFIGGSITVLILLMTLVDLWLVSRLVTYTPMIKQFPLAFLDQSPVREKLLAADNRPVRLFAPGANLPTILGVASIPAYLTFGPAAYVDQNLIMPEEPVADQITWLENAGVTHILKFEPIENVEDWDAHLIWQGFDPFLGRAWSRFDEPIYLYEFGRSRGRAYWVNRNEDIAPTISDDRANEVTLQAESSAGGKLVLADLMYPGWKVTVDGQPAEAQTVSEMFRGVKVPAGRHTVVWKYAPPSVYWGAAISLGCALFLLAVAHIRFWQPHRLNFLDGTVSETDQTP